MSRLKSRETGRDAVISRVLVINTGGTIGMVDKGRGYEPVRGFLESFLRELSIFHDKSFYDPLVHGPGLITGLSKEGRRCYYEVMDFDPVLDSSDMNMKDWCKIAKSIATEYKKWDGFVVLHGTDTMAYTSSALSFMLENLGKTVILTGSQVPISEQRNDGQSNLQGALIVASQFVIPEVTLFFDNKLFRGNRVRKVHASSLSAFGSPNIPPLLSFGTTINVAWDAILRPPQPPFKATLEMDPNVAVLRLFPGITVSTVSAVCRAPIKGVVLQSYGAGNCPEDQGILSAFKAATDAGILILNLTQCHGGFVSDAYRAGKILGEVGVIAGGDLTPEAALAKMCWVLGREGLTFDERSEMLAANLRGERSVIGKKKFTLSDTPFIREISEVLKVTTSLEVRQLKDSLSATLLCCAAASGDVALITELCEEGLHANAADYDGRTSLHIAAAHGRLDAVKYLLSIGASVHAVDRFGYSVLHDAVIKGYSEVYHELIAAGAELKMSSTELGITLCTAAAKGDIESLKRWLDVGADINSADYDNRTALHIACATGQADLIDFLLRQPGIDSGAVDIFGKTPLLEAQSHNHTEAALRVETHL